MALFKSITGQTNRVLLTASTMTVLLLISCGSIPVAEDNKPVAQTRIETPSPTTTPNFKPSTKASTYKILSNIPSGAYNVPQKVSLKSAADGIIYYTLDGSAPENLTHMTYSRPLLINKNTTIKAIAINNGVASPTIELKIQILDKPTAQNTGVFSVVHSGPIQHDITRTAFLHSDSISGDSEIHFSTLERYHSEPFGDRFVFYKYNLKNEELNSVTVFDSIEARSHSYSKTLGVFVLGASLDAQILLYDPNSQKMERVFHKTGGPWIHQIATNGEYAYTILSTPAEAVSGFDGILKVNLRTKDWEVIKFTDKRSQNFGGVESVDPSGRIWYFREHPRVDEWYDAANGMQERNIDGYDTWKVESWDNWGADFYVILRWGNGSFIKKLVDRFTLTPSNDYTTRKTADRDLFEKLLPVDIFHQGSPTISSLYYNPLTGDHYIVDAEKRQIELIGKTDNPNLLLLGLDNTNSIIGWQQGQKIFTKVNLHTHETHTNKIDAPNISPADIHDIAIDRDGSIYGTGVLTNSNLFRLNTFTGANELYEQAIPAGEGQITELIVGPNGNIYGLGYPGSIPFIYNPLKPWDPGNLSTSNPFNLGPIGHYNQTRPSSGLIDVDGNLWYRSNTDYSYPIANALIKVNFQTQAVVVKTDLDDNFPLIHSLVEFDDSSLLLYGEKEKKHSLYLLDRNSFDIIREHALPDNIEGKVFDLLENQANPDEIYFAEENILHKVLDDLSIHPIHHSLGRIERIVRGETNEIIIVGESHIEMINNVTGDWEVWWDGGNDKSKQVFRHLGYTPVAYHQGSLLIADAFELKSFTPKR